MIGRGQPATAVLDSTGLAVSATDDAADWDAHVAAHRQATAYHQWGWRDVFGEAFGHASHYLVARRHGRITGGLPLVEFRSRIFGAFAVSLPFVNYGGVVADDEETAAALVGEAVSWARSRALSHIELRHRAVLAPPWPAKRHKVAMWLSLEHDETAQWSALDRKVRNQVRKAEKAGLVTEVGGAERLDDFYSVFARNMRDLGTPVYSPRFFASILRTFPESARVFIVRLDRLPIAGSITIRWRDTVEVPWASSLRGHSDKAPNMLLYWAMLRHAIAVGASRFDFGRSTPDEGTFHFKRQWGAVPQPLVWEYAGLEGTVPDQSPKNAKFRLAIALWQRLPVAIANRIGPVVVRNIP
jgi:FemAB-related protein (PEP-CTERM system-associated)